ncbi:MAG: SRPBCC domain-containing protein [bacterium]|nr:SRPBCC domain-containing protein [bacterium]
MTQWNFANPSWHCLRAENDLTIGGKYLARMEAKDGSFGFNFDFTYAELAFGEKFTYTMSHNREVKVSLP